MEKNIVGNKTTELHEAAGSGNIERIRKLAEKMDINAQNEKGETPLMVAVVGQQFNSVQELINLKADVNVKDPNGLTAIMKNSSPEIINLLRANGASTQVFGVAPLGKKEVNENAHQSVFQTTTTIKSNAFESCYNQCRARYADTPRRENILIQAPLAASHLNPEQGHIPASSFIPEKVNLYPAKDHTKRRQFFEGHDKDFYDPRKSTIERLCINFAFLKNSVAEPGESPSWDLLNAELEHLCHPVSVKNDLVWPQIFPSRGKNMFTDLVKFYNKILRRNLSIKLSYSEKNLLSDEDGPS